MSGIPHIEAEAAVAGEGAIPRGLQSYSRWEKRHRGGGAGWLAVVRAGIKLARKDNQGRALMYMSLSYVLGTCGLFYVLYLVESFADSPDVRGYTDFLSHILNINLRSVEQFSDLRPVLWRAVFFVSVRAQIVWIALIVSRIGPGLIADDLRSRALPIYFAKPITPLGYLWGKWLVIAVYIAWLSPIPNLLVLIFATLLTGGLSTWAATFALAGHLLVIGVGLMVVAGAIVLALSALGTDRRYVVVAWIALCVLPVVAQGLLVDQLGARNLNGWLGSISLYGDAAVLAEWMLGVKTMLAQSRLPTEAFHGTILTSVKPFYPAAVLAVLTVGAVVVAYRRVVKFSRSAANL